MAQQFTPWQRMRAYEKQVHKIEDHWINKAKRDAATPKEGVIVAEPMEPCCKRDLTYYNNGKCNTCYKVPYDYNFFFCEGYDQFRHRDDRKHAIRYMQTALEEEYPCRTVPMLTSSNYGHRPPYDNLPVIPRQHATRTFFRSRGTGYCVDANGPLGNHNVKLNPTKSFQWNAHYGYTYSPPKN